ncbi:MAG TPA: hypothetical protein DEV93_02115 [Chloroflexi bacterium]|jgi:hypothetical protein|nr:hypothetical protein [Chloroflexota bacterium]
MPSIPAKLRLPAGKEKEVDRVNLFKKVTFPSQGAVRCALGWCQATLSGSLGRQRAARRSQISDTSGSATIKPRWSALAAEVSQNVIKGQTARYAAMP